MFKDEYTIIKMEDLNNFFNGQSLPPKPLLLTFDDGYIDHYTEIPFLLDQGIQGSFFSPSRPRSKWEIVRCE